MRRGDRPKMVEELAGIRLEQTAATPSRGGGAPEGPLRRHDAVLLLSVGSDIGQTVTDSDTIKLDGATWRLLDSFYSCPWLRSSRVKWVSSMPGSTSARGRC